MKKKCFILLAILAMLFCGCAKEEPNPDAIDFSTAPTLPVEEIPELPSLELVEDGVESNWGFDLETEIGIFRQEFIDHGDNDSYFLLFFEDRATGENYPLCTRINCTHDSRECSAYSPYYTSMHYDGKYLYLVGKENPEATTDVVIRQNLDGTDRKVVYRPDHVPESGSFSMNTCVFRDGCVYYSGWGTVFDPETAEIKMTERVFIGNLTTGKTTMIPIEFYGRGMGTTLTIHGMYGKEPFILRTTGNEGILPVSSYHEMFFLLNVDTFDITVVMELTGDCKRAFDCALKQGLVYFRFQNTSNEVNQNAVIIGDENDPSYSLYDGDVRIVDISNRKVYEMTDLHLSHDNGLEVKAGDPYWVYLTYNEDRSVVTKYAQNVQTGEVYLYNEIFN